MGHRSGLREYEVVFEANGVLLYSQSSLPTFLLYRLTGYRAYSLRLLTWDMSLMITLRGLPTESRTSIRKRVVSGNYKLEGTLVVVRRMSIQIHTNPR